MTPKPQEAASPQQTAPVTAAEDGERVVISGMAGLYPQARYVSDLERILYDKVNPISSENTRWKYDHPEVAQYTGNVPYLDRFDAQFFKVHYKLGINMDSMSRKILEQTYEAIYDAGMSPEHLSGKKVGVYVGTCFSETEKACFYAAACRSGFGIAGCSKSMFANRISYWLNAKGPSVSIDQACCSSTAALEAAYRAISHGECEAAVVGGAYLCLHPQSSVHLGRIMNLSMDGKTKSFAEDASGCAKSEAINVLFLQKAKNAKRIYADVVYVKSEFLSILKGETGPRYGFYRNSAELVNFMKNFYKEAGVPPSIVEYVEAFGSAVPEADKTELETIDKVFCEGRKEPLLVGSVMSNIGYGEAASGISAVTKVLLGYHVGSLAGNLHCTEPRRDVAALREGRMRVLTEHARFRRTYVAVNSMSVTGVNAHVLLNGHYKPKDLNRYKCNIPRLVTVSGRQESSVWKVINQLKSHPIDPEELALLHNIHETNITGHLGKGYTILDTNAEGATISVGQRVEYCDGARRPLWFVYSGMGSQWAGMGAQLMRIPIFAAAIERCRKVLEPRGLDIVHIITSPDKTIFDNILHSFVGIAAVQIGLTDILLQLGLVPDNIIGHSVGELGCAYADGCLTAEEMILSAYSRGRVSLETPFIRGSMAAVGLGAKQMLSMCPPEIAIACHNSAESCTISGPADVMRAFVADLTARGVFAKEVPCSNIAYHSRYIAEAGPGLLKYLKEVIKTPRARSSRWVSSSVARERWEEPAAKYSSAEYHTNNLLSPVLFEEASALIPADAVLVEVAPHGLLQAILKRALPDSAANIPLTRRSHTDSVTMLLDAIGKLYLHGYNPKVRLLYPTVEFPVSTGTPFLSHYVDWAHQDKWVLPLYQSARRTKTAAYSCVISIHDNDYSYLRGHVIKNKILLPASFALVAAWDTLSMTLDAPKKSLSVEFSDVKLYAQPILHEKKTFRLSVSIQRGSGMFEIMNEGCKIASGYISVIPSSKVEGATESDTSYIVTPSEPEPSELSVRDVYSALYERGYGYSGEFCRIFGTNNSLAEAKVSWNDNWVTLIDSMIQLQTLKYTDSGIALPERIRRIVVDPKNLQENLKTYKDKENNMTTLLDVTLCGVQDRTRCGGVIIENVRFCNLREIISEKIALETLKFVPRFDSKFDISTSLYISLQIVAENLTKESINVIGLNIDPHAPLFVEIEKIAVKGVAGMKVAYQHKVIDIGVNDNKRLYENVDVILVKNLSKTEKIYKRLHNILPRNTFILNEEEMTAQAAEVFPMNFYNIVSVIKNDQSKLELASWKSVILSPLTSAFSVRSESDLPLLTYARKSSHPNSGLLVLASYPPAAGLIDLVQKWRREPSSNRIHVIMVNEKSKENHDADEVPNVNLAFNIFDNGVWGGAYFLPSEETGAEKESVTLRSGVIGDLNSLQWAKMPELSGTGTLVSIQYAGLNVGDMKKALGLISNSTRNDTHQGYGMEYSGVTIRGEKVMGLVQNGAASSQVMAHPELMWPVPEHWTQEDAATVPFAYTFAYYCLVLRSAMRLKTKAIKQYSVLVHGGAGALGQAVINIALARGWRVFTTVRDQHKKRFLLKLFPKLNEEDIGNSRDASFGDMVLSATNGQGCNSVICCLKGALKNMSLKCCASSSSVIDTTQILNNENFTYGLHYLTNERSYIALDIKSIFEDLSSQEVKKLHALVSEGIANGEVRPLTRVTFAPHEAARAFRLLAASNHRGRVLLRLRDELAPVVPTRTNTEGDACHVVICDANPLGLQVADKLIESGIKRLQLHFHESTGHLHYKLRVWENRNIQVAVEYGSLEEINNISNLLHKATKLGPVESLHVVAFSNLPEDVLRKLDLATRSICPSLKKFVILSNDVYRGQVTCFERAKNGLPATILDLSMLEKFQDPIGGTWYFGAAEAIDRAWQSMDTVVRALSKHTPRQSLIQQVAAITGLDITDEIDDVTLGQLGMPIEKSSIVSSYLKNVYNTYVDEESIPQLTVERLKQIEELVTDKEFKDIQGLETFYSCVDSDELLASTELVYLPTLTNNYQMRDDEFDVTQTSLCIVPGLEGLHARFRTLCERLKLPAIVLQPGLDRPWETPKELAIRYSQILLKRNLQNPFYILGYETGVLVALELAAILEENGATGTIFCVGDGPLEMQELLERELADLPTEAALQEAVMRHMFALMARGTDASADDALRGADSWAARKDACVRALLGHVSHSAQYAHALLETAYARIVVARRAVPEPRPLRSRIVLLRARGERAQGETCSLQQYTQSPLVVEELAAPMAHAAADLRAPAVINSYLDENVLRAFHEKNLCETYLMNADAFMTLPD